MEVGHLIHFSSQKYPFVLETEPCLDPSCSCSVMELTLREVDSSSPPRDRLRFTLRVCPETWTEDDPPPRSLEVETLAREFMVRFPVERKRELAEDFERRRAETSRLQTAVLTSPRDKLVTYSEVVQEEELRQGIDRHAFSSFSKAASSLSKTSTAPIPIAIAGNCIWSSGNELMNSLPGTAARSSSACWPPCLFREK